MALFTGPDGVVASSLCSCKARNPQFRIGREKQKAIRKREQEGSQRDRICTLEAQEAAAAVSSLWKILVRSSIVGPGTSRKIPQLGSGEREETPLGGSANADRGLRLLVRPTDRISSSVQLPAVFGQRNRRRKYQIKQDSRAGPTALTLRCFR
jgi:hypothetical protein